MSAQAIRAFLLATLAWVLGLALAVVIGLALGVSLPGPAGIVGGALVLGAIVGLAQRRVMRVPGARLVVVTALAAPVAFLASAFVGARLQMPGLTALTGPLVVLAQTALGHPKGEGASPRMSGGSLGVGLGHLGAAWGWGIAVGALIVPGLPLGVRAAALAVPGMMAAIYTGFTRPSPGRTPAVRGSGRSMKTRSATA